MKDLLVVAAVAAEAEVVEDVEEKEGAEVATGSVTVTAPKKPKKGKAALPLKRDRVCEKLCSFWEILCFDFGFWVLLGFHYNYEFQKLLPFYS